VIELKISGTTVSQQLARIAREVRELRGMRAQNSFSREKQDLPKV
jgi:hypothetical protein